MSPDEDDSPLCILQICVTALLKVTYMTVPYPISILEKILGVVTIVIEECMKCSYIDGPVGGYQHHNAVKSVTI